MTPKSGRAQLFNSLVEEQNQKKLEAQSPYGRSYILTDESTKHCLKRSKCENTSIICMKSVQKDFVETVYFTYALLLMILSYFPNKGQYVATGQLYLRRLISL